MLNMTEIIEFGTGVALGWAVLVAIVVHARRTGKQLVTLSDKIGRQDQ